MTPNVHKHETNVAEIIVCYCFLSTPKMAVCFNGYYNLSIQSQKLYNCFRLKALPSTSDTLLCCVFPDASTSGDTKSRVTDSSQSPSYRIRTESEQVSLYSPEQSSLHESEGLLYCLLSIFCSPLCL